MKPFAIICSPGYDTYSEFQAWLWVLAGGANEFNARYEAAEHKMLMKYTAKDKTIDDLVLHIKTETENLLGGVEMLICFWDGKLDATYDIVKQSIRGGTPTMIIPVMRY